MHMRVSGLLLGVALLFQQVAPVAPLAQPPFDEWLSGVRAEAKSRGIGDPTLATLAYDPRRSTLFREELFNALKILDSGDVVPAAMRGSWAGALGQPQFMPSSFLLYAQDFDGDGRRDIWRSTPDVFASIGNFLAAKGWNREQTWGREVRLPAAALDKLREAAPLQTEGCLARR